jgi:hypothetical protein
MSAQDFVKSVANLSWALSVFGVSQAGKVFKGLPTSDPTKRARDSNQAVANSILEQFDVNDNTAYNTGAAVQNALIGLTFGLAQPSNYNPITIAQTSENVAKWAVGLVAQFIPGNRYGTGGTPTGWGPVNISDAELQLANIALGGIQASTPEQVTGPDEPEDC